MNNRTKEEIEQGFYMLDGQTGICHRCQDHAGIVVLIDENGEDIGEEVSDCCGALIWAP